MERIIINGELYIKKAPSKDKYRLQVPYFNITDIETNELLVVKSAKDLEKLPSFVVEILEQNNIIQKSEEVIYDNSGFFQIFSDGNKIYMISRETKQIITFNSLEEAEKEFISLYDFLQKGLYIGRLFGANGINGELLYTYENIYLVKLPFIDTYSVLDRRDPMFQYDTIGEILPMYYEKDGLYKAIVEQELKINADNNEQKR